MKHGIGRGIYAWCVRHVPFKGAVCYTRSLMKRLESLLIRIGIVLCFFGKKSVDGDGAPRFEAISHFFTTGSFPLEKYSLLGPLASAPLWFLGDWFATPETGASFFNVSLFLLCLYVLFRLLRPCLEQVVLRRFLLILIFASLFPYSIRTYYGEPFNALLAAIGLLALYSGWKKWGWVLLPIGVANIPATVVALGTSALRVVWDFKAWRYLALPVLAGGLILFENWLHRGGWIASGYYQPLNIDVEPFNPSPYSGFAGFSFPFVFGLLAIFLSFGKGLLFFTPGLFLPAGRFLKNEVLRKTYVSWLFYLGGLVLIYAKWCSWNGGWYYGPRFFLFASIPASLSLALYLTHSRKWLVQSVVLLAFSLSMWVGLCGILFKQQNLELCRENNFYLEPLCWYMPEYSVLFRPFVMSRELLLADWALIGIYSFVYLVLSFPLWTVLLGKLRSLIRERWSEARTSIRI